MRQAYINMKSEFEMRSISSRESAESTRSKSVEYTNKECIAGPLEKPLFANNSLHYLPNFGKSGGNAVITKVGFTVERDAKTGRQIYKYSVDWLDNSDQPEQRYAEIPKASAVVKKAKNKEGAWCDGPCKSKHAINTEMMQFGICDHNICPSCYEREYSVKLFDGTPGCCNPICVDRDLNIVEEMISGKPKENCGPLSATRSQSQLTSGVTEFIALKIVYFEKDKKGRTVRKRFDREVSGSIRLHQLQNILEHFVPALDACQVYYSDYSRSDEGGLTKLVAFDNLRLSVLLQDSDFFKFVILGPGIRFK